MTTIDADTAQRIRSLLEPKGYHIWCDEDGCAFEYQGDELAGSLADDYANDPATLEESTEAALVHSLNDKAQDSSRIEDMLKAAGGTITFTYNPATDGSSVHEEIVREWLAVFNLPDPRKEVVP